MSTPPPRQITREIARVIKGRMAAYDVRQAEMAQIVGVDQSQLSKMIRGQRQITIDQLERMCHMLELDVGKVVADADRFVSEREWDGEPWIHPFVLDGERYPMSVVTGESDTEPPLLAREEEEEVRRNGLDLAAREGKRKGE